MEDQNKPPKKEKDSRKDAFLRQAQAIIVSQRQWNDDTRLKLRVLADRLKLPAKVYEAALKELADSQNADSKTRWEAAYVEYLEKQFLKLPSDILTLKAERKAIDYGRKRFELTVDACERLIEQAAEAMDKVRISETEALRHAKNEVKRLTSGKFEQDESLIEQIVAAVSDWGVDPERARQLMDMQLAANRTKRRSRRVRTLLIRSALLVLGLGSIAATVYLGQIIARIESRETVGNPEKKLKDVPVVDASKATPDWWDEDTKRYFNSVMNKHVPAEIATKLVSQQASARSDAYHFLLDQAWRSPLRSDSDDSSVIDLESVGFQNALIHWFVFEPEAKNSYQIFSRLSNQIHDALNDRDTDISSALFAVTRRVFAQRLLNRLVVAAQDSPRNQDLFAAIAAADSRWSKVGKVDAADLAKQNFEIGNQQWIDFVQRKCWSTWPLDQGATISLNPAIMDFLLQNSVASTDVEDKSAKLVRLKLLTAFAIVDVEYAEQQWSFICEQVADLAAEDRGIGVSLLMATTDQQRHTTLVNALLSDQQHEIDVSVSDGFLTGLAIGKQLGVSDSIDLPQDRLRWLFVARFLDQAENRNSPVRQQVSELMKWNSLALSLLEDRWDYKRFQEIALGETSESTTNDQRADEGLVMASKYIKAVIDSSESLELANALEEIAERLSNGKRLTTTLAEQLVSRFWPVEDEAELQAWRSVMPSLFRSPEFLIVFSDRLAESGEAGRLKLKQLTDWPELQMVQAIDGPQSLKRQGLDRLMIREQGQLNWLADSFSRQIKWRSAIMQRGSTADFTDSDWLADFRQLLSLVSDDEIQFPANIDDRFANALVLQHALLEYLNLRYGNPIDGFRSQDIQASESVESLLESELSLARILVSQLKKEGWE